jgi:D-alanine transfer protein
MQRAAFAQPDLLPIYGSSELVRATPSKASLFFAHYPTHFTVFPVGRAGCSSLIILQKLAAIGPALRGKKVAISISPGWFLTTVGKPKYYYGNFSAIQAGELLFSPELSYDLKREAARRMLEFPRSLDDDPTLKFALHRLAGDTFADRFEFALLTPFGKLQSLIRRAQDDFETTLYILQHRGELTAEIPHRPAHLDWNTVLDQAARRSLKFRRFDEPPDPNVASDAVFLDNVTHAHEWTDFELLLRGLRELGAQPLLLNIPMNGPYYDHIGIAPATREIYVQHLRALAAQYDMPLLDFTEHEQDARFLVDPHDHLSIKGWAYFDQALDAFYHGHLGQP